MSYPDRPWRKLATVSLVAVVWLAGCSYQPPERDASPIPAPAEQPTARCEVAGDDQSEWLSTTDSQRVINLLTSALGKRFGEATKSGLTLPLSKGLIGVTSEPESRTVVVVVDPSVTDVAALQAELSGILAADRIRNPSSPPLSLRVQPGCNAVKDLLELDQKIKRRNWSPEASTATYTSDLDPRTSRFRMVFHENSRIAAEALEKQASTLVTVVYGPVQRSTRSSDSQPHWGGAGIGVDGDGRPNVCSSGFTVDTAGSGKAMVTAGHCFNNGQKIESGSQAYGTAQGKRSYPAYDMMLINDSNQDYDDDIYHDPIRSELSPIDVSGSLNSVVGTSLCISGMVHKTVCGNVVKSLTGQVCDSNGCTLGLIKTVRSGLDPCAEGTSGGPMYTGGASAKVSGLLVATDGESCFGEKVASIRDHLNVTVAVSP